jgi:adenine-specific DNA-methyltransferase
MAKNGSKQKEKKKVETLTHDKAKRRNIPTAEFQSVMRVDEQSPIRVAYERRNRDLDPQLVWRGKDDQDWSDLVVHAPLLYIQEKVQPKVLIDELQRRTEADSSAANDQIDLFADFNGLPSEAAKTEFYQHDAHWSNRMILGDSLQVMASLSEREGLRGQVQCIYIDPPYGIKFNSNFQWSTTSRDVKDGNVEHITREPEQVKAFRDTWRDGIHSYLTYLRDRLTVARDLLTESGSIFVQIGDENLHLVRSLLSEVFGEANRCAVITVRKTSSANSPQAKVNVLGSVTDYVLWYAKDIDRIKYRQPYVRKEFGGEGGAQYQWIESETGRPRPMTSEEAVNLDRVLSDGAKLLRPDTLSSAGYSEALSQAFDFQAISYGLPANTHWKTTKSGLCNLAKADRLIPIGKRLYYKRFIDDFGVFPLTNIWVDVGSSGFSDPRIYVVQTVSRIIERCILMVTDPGDLVIDPTCGSGTTAYVSEQWGRRWITVDTSRVALALARARIMGARYPYYLLADSREGQIKEAGLTKTVPSEAPTHGNIRQGFVYERVPHITLKSIANNAEIDVMWDESQKVLEPLRQKLNSALQVNWEERQIPRDAEGKWRKETKEVHAEWWKQRIARQTAIDASIGAKADFEYLYDKPYQDNKRVRVAGPFTVESLSPHRVVSIDEDGEWIDGQPTSKTSRRDEADFVEMILENLKAAGVQQAHKADKILFSSITPWPGYFVCAEGKYFEGAGKSEKRAAIFVGPEFGTVSRPDLVAAAREAGDAGFDVLITCAFNYDAHSAEFNKLGRIPVLKARMNADLHMADDLKNTGKGNLFVIFGEPDIDIVKAKDGQVQVKVNGVDVFHPNTGEVRSDGADGIACWFIDTDYNEESFFVRHAYFLGANDPYKALKTTLKAEINEEAWATLHSDISRPFDKPESGRIAVKVINHLGDEVMKVFKV